MFIINYNEKLKLVLRTIIRRKNLESPEVLSEIDKLELYHIIEDLYSDKMIQGSWRNGPLNKYKGGAMIDPELYVTKKGHEFLDGTSDKPTIKNEFHVQGGIHSSNIGDYGTVTNNYGSSLSELQSLIQELPGSDKIEGEQMLQVIEREEIKPGFLSKFNSFLEKYPKIASAAGKILLTAATSL